MIAQLSRIVLSVVLVLVAAQRARAEDPVLEPSSGVERARLHFKAGVDYYRDGDYSAALIEFKRAYAASPNYRVLYNLGQVSQELRDYPEAKRYYETYLREGGEGIDAARKQEVGTALVRLRARIAEIVVSSSVEDAEFFVDDVSVGQGPFDEPLLVSAGRRRISASAPGFARATQVIEAAGGETLEVHLELAELTPAAVAAQLPAPAAHSSEELAPAAKSGSSVALWLGLGTGALAISAGVLGYLALEAGKDYREALDHKISASQLDDLHDDAMGKALATDILLAATVVSGGLTLYFALSGGDEERAHLELGPGRLRLRGQF
ncbi:MAG TPA: PEGA domain-containing protein [Polyangiales bacterium]|nr:PEGA domain-containing protein [Polyangiales bacterium]